VSLIKKKQLKLTSLFAQYLYINKSLVLQGIGSFVLDPAVHIPAENEKNPKTILEGVSFQFNLRAEEDPGLIDFIVKQTGKIKPLASADLDSFITLGKQFLNIGKPFPLEGIGTLEMVKQGVYEFTPGNVIAQRSEEPANERMKEKAPEEKYNYNEYLYNEKKGNGKQVLAIAAMVLVVAMLGVGGYFLYKYFSAEKPVSNTAAAIKDVEAIPVAPAAVNADSIAAAKKRDSLAALQPVPAGMITYRIVVEDTNNKVRALTRFSKLKSFGFPVFMETPDSVNFKIFYTFTRPPADTARTRDSLRRIFVKKVYIQL
jgi:hypothetical protein